MSSELKELAAAALRGMARSSLPEPGPTPLGQALARVTAPTPESTLLLRAGLAGLHARAGQPPVKASADIPPALPPDANPVPQALSELLPQVSSYLKVLTELIGFVAAAGQTLGPGDLWSLRQSNMPIDLWTVLGERGRWLARQNPEWRGLDPAQYSKDVRVQVLRAEILEAHAADPQRVAAELLTRWPTLKADERRAVLEGVAASLHPADEPLLALARADKLRDIQQAARQLSAHLPGEAQEAVEAALKASVSVGRSGKIKFLAADLPAALGTVDPKDTYDSALARLIGALPLPLILATLNITPAQLFSGVRDDPGYRMTSELGKALRGDLNLELARHFHESLDFDHWPQARIRRLALEAVSAVSLGAPDQALLGLLASLLAALDEPLAMTQAQQARLHRLAAALLTELAAPDASEQGSDVALNLLSQLAVHLSPHLPLPPLPELAAPEPLPEKPKKEDEARHSRRTYYLIRVERMYAELGQVLTLRRRVAETMGRAP